MDLATKKHNGKQSSITRLHLFSFFPFVFASDVSIIKIWKLFSFRDRRSRLALVMFQFLPTPPLYLGGGVGGGKTDALYMTAVLQHSNHLSHS
ncbi:uncharacterized protein BO66DRAFT_67303 [Aspergillus aculeatinus CBS 121060]|uniref:Uncharacterized protein n=1 Tax=Aspergillus aculeatinus CBS 121060 TaxID=1448322 RepID=A0ACD1HML6_9EURO|nr:hypothetical protein BO66DRAFT_67303 [Aspergillus aculeatinus CBS 121060]RAH74816.1 hypothetical protein BO66DRAFT_67303 [Aspergillus aculeatinus CBS 121060]